MREGCEMNRQQKEAVITDLKSLFSESNAAFVVNYKGLSVAQVKKLRRSLREGDALMRVAKARLMKIAVDGIDGADEFKNKFQNQVGLVFANGEVPVVAKQLVEFSKENESLSIVSGFFESSVLTEQQISVLASLPSREELIARLAGTLNAPIVGLARVMQTIILQLPYALKQVSEKKEQGAA